ncbi:lysostaphin resistance A-like protein [Pelagerythrobacter sp.]|uniref:CPBP family intramembrane glutamic endopeptidase n=1 Tax=Pelagerythrobacter sp. TaxID=2800702 RepID=UPI0035AFD064
MKERRDPAQLSRPKMLAVMIAQAAVFTAVGAGIWALSGRALADFVTVDGGQVLVGLAIAAAMIASAAAICFGSPTLSRKLVRTQEKLFGLFGGRLSLTAIIVISLCAGIGEEALFRGGLQTLAGDYVPMPLAIALSSILFTAIHMARPLVMALIFAIGCLFGWLYWQTGSLLAVMIGHAIYDVFALWYVQRELDGMGFYDAQADEAASDP